MAILPLKKKTKSILLVFSSVFLVRGVGFEPTNPYGTAAFTQKALGIALYRAAPFADDDFDLAWQPPRGVDYLTDSPSIKFYLTSS